MVSRLLSLSSKQIDLPLKVDKLLSSSLKADKSIQEGKQTTESVSGGG